MNTIYYASDDVYIAGRKPRITKKFCSNAGYDLKVKRTSDAGKNLAMCKFDKRRFIPRKPRKKVSGLDTRMTDYVEAYVGATKRKKYVGKRFCSDNGFLLKVRRTSEAGRNLAMCRWDDRRFKRGAKATTTTSSKKASKTVRKKKR